MHPKEFLQQLDEKRIVETIAQAESTTSGEIRIFISHRKRPDALAAAQARFDQLGMRNTRHRNAVLIYLVPRSRAFAIVGDKGIHEKCGDDFWNETTRELGQNLRAGSVTDALVCAVQKVGSLLSQHFPDDPENRNELSNEILHD